MKNSLVLVLIFFTLVDYRPAPENKSIKAAIISNVGQTDSILVLDSLKTDSVSSLLPYPWSSEDYPCPLGKYRVKGVIPAMRDSLVALSLEDRLTNGLNLSKAKSNYHGVDFTLENVDYSAAIDISVRCLSEDEIRSLLDELSMRGFAGWYRKSGTDGWTGDNHIHAVWVAAPLKQQLASQVKKWLAGKNGLTSDKDYKFWSPKPEAEKRIRLAFMKSNPD